MVRARHVIPMTDNRVPWSNGSEFDHWYHYNCAQCVHSGHDDDEWALCPLLHAIEMSMGTHELAPEVKAQIGVRDGGICHKRELTPAAIAAAAQAEEDSASGADMAIDVHDDLVRALRHLKEMSEDAQNAFEWSCQEIESNGGDVAEDYDSDLHRASVNADSAKRFVAQALDASEKLIEFLRKKEAKNG